MIRSTRLVPSIPPLTPAIPEARKSPDRQTEAELNREIRALRNILQVARVNNTRRENALGKYAELLEKIVAEQRQAFEQLHAELVPNPLAQKRKGR